MTDLFILTFARQCVTIYTVYREVIMPIQLSDHFTYKRLIRFVFPSVIMMIFTSVYGVVDGVFVSNFVGETPFAAINLIMPFCMLLGAVGFMVGTGGSALVSKYLGEGDKERANRVFSMLIYVSVIFGAIISALGYIFIEPVALLLGAKGDMVGYCVTYGRFLFVGIVPFILQNEFQSFLIVAEKPQIGLGVTVAAGLTNIVLDALFVAVFKWGLEGAALATVTSQLVGGAVPLFYFCLNKKSPLRLGKAVLDLRALGQTCINGSSEMMTNISMSFVNILYNFQLMLFAGESGVAAYGVIMYTNFIFISVFLGYSIGVAPIVSYHYGAQNHAELKSLYKKSLAFIAVSSLVLTAIAELLALPLSKIFVSYNKELFDMTVRAFMIYSLSFIFAGFNIFGSGFFTALNNGVVSAIISFLRTLVFQVAAVLLLPVFFKLDGIWFSIVCAELLAIAVTGGLLVKMRKRYNY